MVWVQEENKGWVSRSTDDPVYGRPALRIVDLNRFPIFTYSSNLQLFSLIVSFILILDHKFFINISQLYRLYYMTVYVD